MDSAEVERRLREAFGSIEKVEYHPRREIIAAIGSEDEYLDALIDGTMPEPLKGFLLPLEARDQFILRALLRMETHLREMKKLAQEINDRYTVAKLASPKVPR